MHDILIIGGGLAGLINALVLSRAGLSVILIERKSYPFHKVCGEYISNEALGYLQSLGFDPFAHGAVALTQFLLSSPQGRSMEMPLDLGGFGISRYTMDHHLYQLAQAAGCKFLLNTSVDKVEAEAGHYRVSTPLGEVYQAQVIIGAYGKRSHVDRNLERSFFTKRSPYFAVKYHIRTDVHPDNQIALHNFADGYCGISRVEAGQYCLCYLSSRHNLRAYRSIPALEKELMSQNPFLKKIFENSEFVYDKPLVINEISFAPKKTIEAGILMCGDTAGLITPLCGNGMAMAIHGAKILSELLIQHFQGSLDRSQLESQYQKSWQKNFARRLRVGRTVQYFFGNPSLGEGFLQLVKHVPPLAQTLVRNSHGQAF